MSEQESFADNTLLVTKSNQVTTITLHQPGKKNAVNQSMSTALLDAIRAAAEDDSRVVVLTGAGGNFCAGADLDPRVIAASGEPFDVARFLKETYSPIILTMRNSDKPFIAKVEGVCVGVGWNFALACDLIYAKSNARFSQIFTKIGLSSDGGGAYFLQERLGHHRAYELLAFHRELSASEAFDWGLVNEVAEDEDFEDMVESYVQKLAKGPFVALSASKSNLRTAETEGLEATLMQEADNQGKNFMTMDFMEGISAFLQKRKPTFRGK